jgi:hypothetical protein
MSYLARAFGLIAVTACIAAATGSAAPTAALSAHASHYRRYGVSFSYPAAWKRLDWCWEGTTVTPLVVLTAGRVSTACDGKRPWFPPGTLHRRNLSVFWAEGGMPGLKWFSTVKRSPTTRVGGQPARTAILTPRARHWHESGCSLTRATVAIVTEIRLAYPVDNYYEMTACLRRPHLTANERAVRTMLASVRFRHSK